MKTALAEAGVPTARHHAFDASEVEEAVAYLRDLPGLYVVKTDGLAAGKGVFVTESLADAIDDLREKLSGASFGDAGTTVVVEEGLSGPELSLLCVCDGEKIATLAPAQDYKRVGDGDAGPNTGGMGAYSPVPFVDGIPRRRDRRAHRRPDAAVASQARHRLPRRALRGSDVDARGTEGHRVQRPLRRSRSGGRAASDDERPHGAARGGGLGSSPQ